jgi:hypothetical protein
MGGQEGKGEGDSPLFFAHDLLTVAFRRVYELYAVYDVYMSVENV